MSPAQFQFSYMSKHTNQVNSLQGQPLNLRMCMHDEKGGSRTSAHIILAVSQRNVPSRDKNQTYGLEAIATTHRRTINYEGVERRRGDTHSNYGCLSSVALWPSPLCRVLSKKRGKKHRGERSD